MAITVGSLIAELKLDSKQFAAEMVASKGLWAGFTSFLGGAAVLGAAAVAVIGVASGKMAMDFQASMLLIRTQAGATQEEVDSMSQSVLELAKSVAQSPEELAQGLYHIESAGLRGADALDLLTTAAHGAEVGQDSLESVTNALIAAVTSGIGGVKDYTTAMGTLDAIIGAGNMRMEDLTASMGSGILTAAKTFGVSLQSVGSALADLTRQGMPAEESATRLRMSMSLMGAPSEKAIKNLKLIGLSSTDLANAMRGPDGILGAIQLLKDHLDASGLSATDQAALISRAFGGGRSSAAIMGLLNDLDQFRRIQDQVNTNQNNFGASWEATQATAKHSLDTLISSLESFLIKIGNGLLPLAKQFFDGLAQGVDNLSSLWDDFFGPGGGADTAGAFIATVQGAFKALWDAFEPFRQAEFAGVRTIIQGLSDGISAFATEIMPTLTQAIDWFNKNVLPVLQSGMDWLSNSVIPTLANAVAGFARDALPALAKGFGWLWDHVLQPLGDFIMNTLVNVVFPAFADALDYISNTVIPALQSAVQWFADNVLPKLAEGWDYLTHTVLPAVQRALQDLWQNVLEPIWRQVLLPLAGFLVDVLGKAWTWLANDVIPQVASAIGDLWNNVLVPLWENVLKPLAAFLADTFAKAWQFISDTVLPALKTAWDDVASAVSSLWNDWLKPFIDFVNNDLIPPIRDTLNTVIGALATAWDTVATAVSSLWNDWLKPFIDFINNDLIPPIRDTLGHVLDVITGLWNTLATAVGAVQKSLQDLGDFVASFTLDPLITVINNLRDAWDKGTQKGQDWVQLIKDGKQPTLDLIGVLTGGPAAWITFASAAWSSAQTVIQQSAGMQTSIKLLKDVISFNFGAIGGDLKDLGLDFTGLGGTGKDVFSTLASLIGTFKTVFSGFATAIKGLIDGLVAKFTAMMQPVYTTFNYISTVLGVFFKIVNTIFGLVATVIRTTVDSISTKLHSMFDPLWNGFQSVIGNVTKAWNAFARFWNGITLHVPEIDLGPLLGKIGGFNIGLPSVPTFSRGGRAWRDMLALTGEKGPELSFMPAAAQVLNSMDTRNLLAQLATGGPPTGGQGSVIYEEHYHIGTLVADENGLWELSQRQREVEARRTRGGPNLWR